MTTYGGSWPMRSGWQEGHLLSDPSPERFGVSGLLYTTGSLLELFDEMSVRLSVR